MRIGIKTLAGTGAALLAFAAWAIPPTPPGAPDPTFAGSGLLTSQFTGSPESARALTFYEQNYFVAGNTTLPGTTLGFVAKVNQDGNPVTGFGTAGTLRIPGFYPQAIWSGSGRVVLGGYQTASSGQPIASIITLNTDTGAAEPACGNPSGLFQLPPTLLVGSQVTSWWAASGSLYGTIVENNAAQNDYRSGVFKLNPVTCRLVTAFGTQGRAMAAGDFFASSGAANRLGGGLLVGATQEPGKVEIALGGWLFDGNGNAGACGPGVKALVTAPAQNFFGAATASYFAPSLAIGMDYYGSYVAAYYRSPSTPFLARVAPNCTIDTTGAPFMVADTGTPYGLGVNQSIDAAATELYLGYRRQINGTPTFQTDIFSVDGGASRVSSAAAFVDPGGDDAVSPPGSVRPKALAAISNTAYGLVVQPDAKYVVAGGATVNNSSSFLARFVGVERTGNVVEFYNDLLRHYFITADPNEASAIDAGSAGPGWSRTGQTWKSGGPNRVCRFYGSNEINPATGLRRGPNSHFYTIVAAECAEVKLDPGWHFESYDFSGWPATGSTCPAGTIPVKRVYNGRFAQNDSNHRYMTSDALYAQMLALGWSGEGTVFCSIT